MRECLRRRAQGIYAHATRIDSNHACASRRHDDAVMDVGVPYTSEREERAVCAFTFARKEVCVAPVASI